MRYLTYDEYTEMGGTLDLTAFNRNIGRACGIIDAATFCRIENMNQIPQAAKECCTNLIEYISSHSVSGKGVVSRSQSAGGVSESETYKDVSADEMYGDIQNILCDYLCAQKDDWGTPLLYRGCIR